MSSRRVSDRVHGDVHLSPVVSRLISSAEVRRLDGIRQLGGCFFVYPAASHTRLEHSIGVAHLASLMGTHLKEQCDRVTERDVECLEIAGLLHDVGHGPFSHLFEEYMREHKEPSWSHEVIGEAIIERLLTRMDFEVCDIAFVKLLVSGLPPGKPIPLEVKRDESVRFLCDVVHNCTSGIDVDKLDYLLRDALAVFGATHSVDATRILRASRIIEGNVLAFDQRVAGSIEQIYELRSRLHMKLYQHREVLVVESMIKDALCARNVDVDDLDGFLSLSDSTVLGCLTDDQHRRLYTHPRLHRVPFYNGHIDVRPICSACSSPTETSHAFCGSCGASTVTRVFETTRLHDGTYVRVSPAAVVTASEISQLVRDAVGHHDVRVFVRDVHNGIPCASSNGWLVYGILSTVVFCDVEGVRIHLSDTGTGCHQRFVYCYTDFDRDTDDVVSALQNVLSGLVA